MKIKKLIAVCLTIVMVCTIMCVPAFASYEVPNDDNRVLNGSFNPGDEVILSVTLVLWKGSELTSRYFDIPVTVEHLDGSYSDWSDHNVCEREIFDNCDLTRIDLGYMDFTGYDDFSFEVDVPTSFGPGKYQLSAFTPCMGVRCSMNGLSYNNYLDSMSICTHGTPSKLGDMVGGANSGYNKISVFDVNDSQDLYLSMSGDVYKGLRNFAGKSGNLVLEFTPFYMYLGEPLEDGVIFPPPAPIKDFMDNVSTIFHSVIDWVALTAETIVSNPLILIFSIVPYIGLGVSIYARIKRTKK